MQATQQGEAREEVQVSAGREARGGAKQLEEAEEDVGREEQWRLEAERHRVKKQAKKHVSCFWFVIMELMVSDGGGCCATVQKGQGQGGGAASVQPVCGVWAQVQTWAW